LGLWYARRVVVKWFVQRRLKYSFWWAMGEMQVNRCREEHLCVWIVMFRDSGADERACDEILHQRGTPDTQREIK
jgi:hypothetical protein